MYALVLDYEAHADQLPTTPRTAPRCGAVVGLDLHHLEPHP